MLHALLRPLVAALVALVLSLGLARVIVDASVWLWERIQHRWRGLLISALTVVIGRFIYTTIVNKEQLLDWMIDGGYAHALQLVSRAVALWEQLSLWNLIAHL